jgi:hypothetical protein
VAEFEKLRLVDRSPECERRDRADAGHRHQPPAHLALFDHRQHRTVQQRELAHDGSARRQHRADDPADLRIALVDQLPDAGFELTRRHLRS